MHVKKRYGIPMPRTIAAAILAATFAASTALAAVPATDDIAFGARPGNVIGTGNSLPASDYASNITEANTQSRIAPPLPQPQAVSESPHALLSAASRALDAGLTGEAQEALERAETRLLSRSVSTERIGDPNANRLVSRIAEARHALAEGDLAHASRLVAASLPPGGTDAHG